MIMLFQYIHTRFTYIIRINKEYRLWQIPVILYHLWLHRKAIIIQGSNFISLINYPISIINGNFLHIIVSFDISIIIEDKTSV